MTQVIYLEPQYITYEMIQPYIVKWNWKVYTDPLDPLPVSGIYIGQVLDTMAKAENEIERLISNYVLLPLVALDGNDFASLENSIYAPYSYTPLRTAFIDNSLAKLAKYYYSSGGQNNGNELVKQLQEQADRATTQFQRLNQVTNPYYKNLLYGLKPVDNASKRIPQGARFPATNFGVDQAWVSQNSIPNFRWGYRR